MKKLLFNVMLLMVFAVSWGFAGGQQGAGSTESGEGWKPSRNVEWFIPSSAGGGSDIFARIIADILVKEGIVTTPITVINRGDGGGELACN